MTEKTHNVTSLPSDAPTADGGEVKVSVKTRVKNAFANNKRFFAGVGAGALATFAVARAVSGSDEDETEETEETPEV